jgi:hypothetical protein
VTPFEQIVRDAIVAHSVSDQVKKPGSHHVIWDASIPAIARAIGERIKEPTQKMCLATSILEFHEGSETEKFIIDIATESWRAMVAELLK